MWCSRGWCGGVNKESKGVGLVEAYQRISQNLMVVGRPVSLLNISLLTIKISIFPNMCKSNLFAKSYTSVEQRQRIHSEV